LIDVYIDVIKRAGVQLDKERPHPPKATPPNQVKILIATSEIHILQLNSIFPVAFNKGYTRLELINPISLRTRIRLAYTPLLRNTSSRTMSNVAAFVAAAERADSSLVGTSDKDKAAIAKLAGEAEKLSKDLPVSRVWMSDRLERVQAGLIAQHSSTSQF
jgi:hypothetical protein